MTIMVEMRNDVESVTDPTFALFVASIAPWGIHYYRVAQEGGPVSNAGVRLGDMIAGSLVVRESSLKDLKPIWQATRTETTPLVGGNMLSVDDLALIDAFLNRRHELAPEVRSRMAIQIFNQVRSRLPETIQPGPSVEAMLESLAWERRAAGQG